MMRKHVPLYEDIEFPAQFTDTELTVRDIKTFYNDMMKSENGKKVYNGFVHSINRSMISNKMIASLVAHGWLFSTEEGKNFLIEKGFSSHPSDNDKTRANLHNDLTDLINTSIEYGHVEENEEFPTDFTEADVARRDVVSFYYQMIGCKEGKDMYDYYVRRYPHYNDTSLSRLIASRILWNTQIGEDFLAEHGLSPDDYDKEDFANMVFALADKIKTHLVK